MKYLFCHIYLFDKFINIYMIDEEKQTNTVLCQTINTIQYIALSLEEQCSQFNINTVKLAGPANFISGIIKLLPDTIKVIHLKGEN